MYVMYVCYICKLYVCYMYVICMLYVCYMYVICMLYVCYMYVICMLYVCYMYVICMLYVCYMYVYMHAMARYGVGKSPSFVNIPADTNGHARFLPYKGFLCGLIYRVTLIILIYYMCMSGSNKNETLCTAYGK
jgi:hypothetical protein